jgi:hypothetical protein
MNSINHRHSKRKGCAAALYATAFLFFLVYSAPHRVHHFFDQVRPAAQDNSDRHHDTADHHDKTTKEPSCAFQVSANRCVFRPAGQIQLLTLALIAQRLCPRIAPANNNLSRRLPSPANRRSILQPLERNNETAESMAHNKGRATSVS